MMGKTELEMVRGLAVNMVEDITKHFSQEQAELFCKVYEADEDTVLKGFGKSKEEVIEMFLVYGMQQARLEKRGA